VLVLAAIAIHLAMTDILFCLSLLNTSMMHPDSILDLPSKETALPVYTSKMGNVFSTPVIYFAPIAIVLSFLIFIIFHPVIGLLLFIACIPFFFSSAWVVIDLNNLEMYEFWTLYGYRTGKRKPIPQVRAVSVVRMKSSQTLTGVRSTPSITFEDYIYKVKLVSAEERRTWDLMDSDNKEKALAMAKRIAERLGVEMRDYSTPLAGAIRRRR
jgi:hypothetical protein